MKSKFKPNLTPQLFLLPPSVEDFVPENHIARLIDEIVNGFDTTEIESKYSHLGQKSYHPKSLIKLWIYGYATGTFSGRKIASHCESDTAYMFFVRGWRPRQPPLASHFHLVSTFLIIECSLKCNPHNA